MAGSSARVQGMQEAQERPGQTEGRCAGTSDPRRPAPDHPETSGCHHELFGPVPERRNGGGVGVRKRRTAHHLSKYVGAGHRLVWRDGPPSEGLLIRPGEVSSRIAHATVLEVADDTLGALLKHRHMFIGGVA